jgi:hypothetical protein
MPEYAGPPVRKEVEEYLLSCEYLLSPAVAPHSPPFTPEELAIVNYYSGEIAKLADQLAKI